MDRLLGSIGRSSESLFGLDEWMNTSKNVIGQCVATRRSLRLAHRSIPCPIKAIYSDQSSSSDNETDSAYTDIGEVLESEEEMEQEEHDSYTKPTQSPPQRNPKLSSRVRIRWTKEDEKKLREGVKIYGVGHWKQIREEKQLFQYTTVGLKDKWRNMNKKKSK